VLRSVKFRSVADVVVISPSGPRTICEQSDLTPCEQSVISVCAEIVEIALSIWMSK